MTAKDPPPDPAPTPAATLRLTFAYRGRDIRLVASRQVAMVAPPGVTPAPVPGQSGYWCELRGADHRAPVKPAHLRPARVASLLRYGKWPGDEPSSVSIRTRAGENG